MTGVSPPLTYLRHGEADYPAQLADYVGEHAPAVVALWGERDIWFKRHDNEPLLALFCSTKAPASILLQVHDLAQGWRTGEVTVIGGFHSPVEQECLAVCGTPKDLFDFGAPKDGPGGAVGIREGN